MQTTNKMKVWDSATRIYHWAQALLVLLLWWSAENEWFGLHQMAAYVLASLLGARLVWAFVGSDTSRLSHFFHGPSTTLRLVRQGAPSVGHNPVSAYMIVLLWLLLVLQFSSGLMSSDDLSFEGPWYSLVPEWLQSLAGGWHHQGFDLLLICIGVHVLAAVVHEVKGQRVIASMVTGQKRHEPPVELKFVAAWRYWALVALFAAVFGYWQGAAVWAALQADLALL